MNLNFKSSGQGIPFVILHGLFGSSDNWSGIARGLETHFQVLSVDLRNHGRSPHNASMSYDEMAGDLLEFLGDHGINRTYLMGHSLGGKVAMRFAQLYPSRLLKLIVVDISPKEYPPEHRRILDALLKLHLPEFTQRSQVEDALGPAIPDLGLRRFLLKNLERAPDGSFRWRMGLASLANNYARLTQALPEVTFAGPALFLTGALSTYVPSEDLPLVRRLFPESEIRTVPGAGHWVHAENPTQFLAEVLRFARAGRDKQDTGGSAPDAS
jgi:esterase